MVDRAPPDDCLGLGPICSAEGALAPVVERLCEPTGRFARTQCAGLGRRDLLPSRPAVEEIVHDLRAALFPGYYSDWDLCEESLRFYVGSTLDRVLHRLSEQVKRGLCLACAGSEFDPRVCEDRALVIARRFLARLPELRRVLATDVEAAYEGDPAATGAAEVILAYPGLQAVTDFRLAHELHVLGASLLPRIITEHAHQNTGIDIHPGASIGERFFIDHGTGVVIGETAEIGRNVRIYQGVTLGARSFPLDEHGNPVKGVPRHPIVEDDVIIYSGATILGRVTLGRGSVIGGNVWLTNSVPPGSRVTQSAVRQTQFDEGAGI